MFNNGCLQHFQVIGRIQRGTAMLIDRGHLPIRQKAHSGRTAKERLVTSSLNRSDKQTKADADANDPESWKQQVLVSSSEEIDQP